MKNIAKLYYIDHDKTDLGMVIGQAQSSALGRWQYAKSSNSRWEDVSKI